MADSALPMIRNNLNNLYPRPHIDPDWLATTLADLLAPDPTLSKQLQIKLTHQTFLKTDLDRSTVHGTGFGDALVPARGEEEMHDLVVFPGKGCLAQIVSITEVGSSAFNLRKTLHVRREARSGRARIRRLPGEGEDEEEEDRKEEGKYPRGMLKLEVSDGTQVCRAIEYKRIEGLKLGETHLGCKVVLRNVRVLRGVLLLTPETCIVKGEGVDALCAEGRDEQEFEKGLRVRLGLPEEALLEAAAPRSPPAAAHPSEDEEMDDYIPDDFDLPDAHARVQLPPFRQARPVPPPARQARPDPPPSPLVARLSSPRKEVQVEDDPMEEWDEDALIAAAEAELAAQDEQEVRAFNGRVYERPDQVAPERLVDSSVGGGSNAVAGPSRPKAPPSSSSTSNSSKTVKSSQPHQPSTHPFFSSSATATSISRPSKPPPPSRSKVKAETVTISSSDESEAASSKTQPKKKVKKEAGKKDGTSGAGKRVKGWEQEVEVIELD